MTNVPMPPKISLAIVALCSNLLLFYILMLLENRDGYHLLFVGVRIVLLTSVIMQILIAIGIVKPSWLK